MRRIQHRMLSAAQLTVTNWMRAWIWNITGVLVLGGMLLGIQPDSVMATTVTRSEMADNTFQFVAFVDATVGVKPDGVDYFDKDKPNGETRENREWEMNISLNELDGEGDVEGVLEILITSTHLISPFGGIHTDDKDPNSNFLEIRESIGKPKSYKPGKNNFTLTPDKEDHPGVTPPHPTMIP